MAVRDRNLFAWQAYVITMAFLSVALLLGMFFLWRSYSDLSKRFTDQGTQLSTAQQEFATSNSRVERLLSMLGKGDLSQGDMDAMKEKFAADPMLADVEKEFESLMNLFAPNDATSKNLTTLPKHLLDTIRIRNKQVDDARQRELELQKQTSDTIQSETKAREDAVAAQKKAEADLEAARQAHAAAVTKLNEEKQEAYARFDAYKTDMDTKMEQLTAVKNQLDELSKKQAETIATQIEIINQFNEPDFAAPQGEIFRVANGGTTVWINIGSNQGLRVGVPFSVIDEAEINITNATSKANLVVVEVIDGNMSRARVENYDPRKTLVPGDKVYSPAWRPGRTIGFALVGMMDMNNDDRDDAEQVRELIRSAGGKIDAEVNYRGEKNDKLPGMTPYTTYLVLGTDLEAGDNANLRADQAQRARAYTKFLGEARSMGVQTITLDKLMGFLKTEATSRTIPLGDRLRGGDFPIKEQLNPPTSDGKVSDVFQKRSPR
jgi:hypothetical protein